MADLLLSGRPIQVYVWVIVVLGVAAISESIFQLWSTPLSHQWLILATLTLICSSATVRLPSVPSTSSISETFVFTAVLLFGPAAGTAIVAIDCLVISFWLARKLPEVPRLLFNISAPALSVWLSARIFFLIANTDPFIVQPVDLSSLLLPLSVFALLYFLLNSWLITMVIALERGGHSPLRIWRDNFAWLSLNYFGAASVAALLLPYTRNLDLVYLVAVVPLLLIIYFTFKSSMGRVEDANAHLNKLNALYLSTIETLAMAIDAKDQITHGHIRRVQLYAVGLAKALHITDEKEIKAIEAAALLHDMGKLAVPEYILNKPGKLTPAEFEKMKTHASVGADILSAIDFPYPVVPIVRHHHENWNGRGYPDGLKGTDIPIGARILSVVDCFDALTSDRPYRPRLTDDDAMKIVLERRGNMYDPEVVDTFLRVYGDIAPRDTEIKTPRKALAAITEAAAHASRPETSVAPASATDAAGSNAILVLYDLAAALNGQFSLADAGDVIAKHLGRVVPASLCVFFLYDPSSDELGVAHAVGDGAESIGALRMTPGQRLTGWVAANRQTIMNSDPVLDLGDLARRDSTVFRSCLSTPLQRDGQLIGVLTLYHASPDAYSDNHRRIVETLSWDIAEIVAAAVEFERRAAQEFRDSVTGLPNAQYFARFVARTQNQPGRMALPLSVLVCAIRMRDANSGITDHMIFAVATAVRGVLRLSDVLFRFRRHEFVVVLPQTDSLASRAIADRIADCVATILCADGQAADAVFNVGMATSPDDGARVTDLVEIACGRAGATTFSDRRSTIRSTGGSTLVESSLSK